MKNTLYNQIFTDIANKINSKVYLPEEKLPTDLELCAFYSVSLITIKKAMKLLVADNYVKRVPHVGTFVCSSDDKVKFSKPIISLIVPEYSEVFCLEIVNTFEKTCRKRGFVPLISRTFGSRDDETNIINEHINLGSSGIIIMPIHDEYFNETLLKLAAKKFPIVTIDRKIPRVDISSVVTDNFSSVKLIANHLIAKNKKYPLIISPTFKNSSNLRDRINGFSNCFNNFKILNYDNYLPTPNQVFNNFDFTALAQELKKFITAGCDVIFCTEYNIALDVKKILDQYQNQLEVVCFDHPTGRNKIKFTHILQDQKQLTLSALDHIITLQKCNEDIKHIEILGSLITID